MDKNKTRIISLLSHNNIKTGIMRIGKVPTVILMFGVLIKYRIVHDAWIYKVQTWTQIESFVSVMLSDLKYLITNRTYNLIRY